MLHTSAYWEQHFRTNLTIQRVDWATGPAITTEEKKRVLYSLKAWQLGETSDGRHLLAAAHRHAVRIGDEHYVAAVQQFIREEQKHGANLGRYIDTIGEVRARSDWGDTLFRKIRYFNRSMELWTITVIIVESAAQVFYQALHDATRCSLLRSICTDILIDEAHHIKFQNERLWTIFQQKGFYTKALSLLLYSFLFFGTIHAVWYGHRKALIAGGVHRTEFMRAMYYKFFSTVKFVHRKVEVPELSLVECDRDGLGLLVRRVNVHAHLQEQIGPAYSEHGSANKLMATNILGLSGARFASTGVV